MNLKQVVSIRSPHRSEGRLPNSDRSAYPIEFQSAPLTEARGDIRIFTYAQPFCQFQSAPLTEARGDLYKPVGDWKRYLVSIRSPHRSEGRPVMLIVSPLFPFVSIRSPHRSEGRPNSDFFISPLGEFQSAPLTEARGDRIPGLAPVRTAGFNPLPSPKRGETIPVVPPESLRKVSIRSPHRSEGRQNIQRYD